MFSLLERKKKHNSSVISTSNHLKQNHAADGNPGKINFESPHSTK
jgi:hypothetical protein